MEESVEDVSMVDGVEILKGWDKQEKHELLYAIKSFGSKNVLQIHDIIPKKSPANIQAAINHYRQRAIKYKEGLKAKAMEQTRINTKSKINMKPKIPLASWAKFLTDSLSFKELQTETATAVRLIASLENIPSAVCTDNIDFKKIYHLMANAMEGKPIPEDKLSGSVLKKCIIETALVSKAFLRTSTFRYLVNSLNVSEKSLTVFPKPTSDHELTILRHLISQRAYNPLNIPEQHLKPSSSSSD